MALPEAETSAQIRWCRPRKGRWLAKLLNFLLRITVKRHLHGLADVLAFRRHQEAANRRFGGSRSAGLTRYVTCDGVAAQWLTPPEVTSDSVILHLHGGAFVAASPDLHADMVSGWARGLKTPALLPEYRLAPEHRFPAGLDDCVRVYEWLLAQGYAGDQVVLSGDSAGGNLALGLLQRIKAQALPMPTCVVLLSPFVDFSLNGDSLISEARRDPLFTTDFVLSFRQHYLNPEQILDPMASPLYGDYAATPPVLVQVGEFEMLRDESVRITEVINRSGGSAELVIWAGLPHVFQVFERLPQAVEANRQICRFIENHAFRQGSADRFQPNSNPAN